MITVADFRRSGKIRISPTNIAKKSGFIIKPRLKPLPHLLNEPPKSDFHATQFVEWVNCGRKTIGKAKRTGRQLYFSSVLSVLLWTICPEKDSGPQLFQNIAESSSRPFFYGRFNPFFDFFSSRPSFFVVLQRNSFDATLRRPSKKWLFWWQKSRHCKCVHETHFSYSGVQTLNVT